MVSKPDIRCFLYEKNRSVDETDPAWNSPLPLNRKDTVHPSHGPNSPSYPITLGEYFSAAIIFLKKNKFSDLCHAVTESLNQKTGPQDIDQISIYLEKHGRFYHPARVVVLLPGQEISFVLNVALTELGRFWIQNEFQTLIRLNSLFSNTYLPRVYRCEEVKLDSEKTKIMMFLGDWFHQYHEFHLTRDQKSRKQKISVWDPVKGRVFLSHRQTFDLYRQAARILTFYYQIDTYEQIFPWHHAAGDFIVKTDENTLDVRLITARQYAPLTGNSDHDAISILNELMLFFLNLTIWMRLDREDGVGDILWAGDTAVNATIQGFFEGLKNKPRMVSMNETIMTEFQKYISIWQKTEILKLLNNISGLLHPQTPEIPVIQSHLEEHAEQVFHALKKYRTNIP